MSDTPSGASPGLLPVVLLASGLALAQPGVAQAHTAAPIATSGDLPAVMQTLPKSFLLPERLAAYEEEKTEETQVAMRFMDWLFGDGPVNRCGTTSGCSSGWDDSDCF